MTVRTVFGRTLASRSETHPSDLTGLSTRAQRGIARWAYRLNTSSFDELTKFDSPLLMFKPNDLTVLELLKTQGIGSRILREIIGYLTIRCPSVGIRLAHEYFRRGLDEDAKMRQAMVACPSCGASLWLQDGPP